MWHCPFKGGSAKAAGLGMGIRSFQKNVSFSRSFTFFLKEWPVLYILFRSFKKNVSFSTFFFLSVKRMFHSFLEHFVRFSSFFVPFLGVKSGFISCQKLENRTKPSKMNETFIYVHFCSFLFSFYFLGLISRQKLEPAALRRNRLRLGSAAGRFVRYWDSLPNAALKSYQVNFFLFLLFASVGDPAL